MPDPVQPPGPRIVVLIAQREGGAAGLELTQRTCDAQAALPRAATRTLEPRASLADAIRAAAREYPDCDVVCLLAGVELPLAWDLRLSKAAHAEAGIAAAVPLCDASPLHALVLDEAHREVASRDVALVDRTAFCMGTRGYYETPAMHPACAYLRRDALQRLEGCDPAHADGATVLNLMARLWRSRGEQTVLCDYLYVGFDPRMQFGTPGADDVEVEAFLRHGPLGSLRRGVSEAFAAGLPPVSAPALDTRPVQLHVMHFWGGGLDKWVRDFARADVERTNLMLATYRIGERGGQRVVLYSDPDARVPIRTWDIARPLRATAAGSIEYRGILEQVIAEYQVESIIVSSLIGHSLEALRQPVRTLVVAHDFYPLCQSINPRLDEVCRGCDFADLPGCSAANPHYMTLGSPPPVEWQALREAYVALLLERHIEVVVPSPSVADMLKRIEPRLGALPIHVIPHGIEFAVERLPYTSPASGERLRLVVLGRLPQNKGAGLLEAAAARLAPIADITLVGCGPHAMKLARDCGWAAIEAYTHEELPGILRRIAPHAAILASVVPETFSYTLSELWALGIPPLATALGSFRDRIRDGFDGVLFEPDADTLVDVVRQLRDEPRRLERIAAEVARRPPPRTTRQMVADYHVLLPLAHRALARFPVDIGVETALTEPYRHLQQAYAHLQSAYEQVSDAYGKTSAAYDHATSEYRRVDAELTRLRALCGEYSRHLQLLQVGRRWWKAPEAQRLVTELRQKMGEPGGAPRTEDKAQSIT